MNLASLGSFVNHNIGSIFGNGIQGATSNNNNSSRNVGAGGGGEFGDHSQLSPLAQIVNTLQHAQQSSAGSGYQQLTQLIASSLQAAAQQSGNAQVGNQLSQLAGDFANAASTGGLPNVNDLANALGANTGSGSGSSIEETSFSLQINITEASASNVSQAATNSTALVPAGNAAANQDQFQANSLSINFSETSLSYSSGQYANAPSTNGGQADTQQLLGLIAQALQSAAQNAQSGGSSDLAKLLKQLATEFTNALDGVGSGSSSASSAGAGAPVVGTGDSYNGSASGTNPAGSSSGSQATGQSIEESVLAYQISYSSTNVYSS